MKGFVVRCFHLGAVLVLALADVGAAQNPRLNASQGTDPFNVNSRAPSDIFTVGPENTSIRPYRPDRYSSQCVEELRADLSTEGIPYGLLQSFVGGVEKVRKLGVPMRTGRGPEELTGPPKGYIWYGSYGTPAMDMNVICVKEWSCHRNGYYQACIGFQVVRVRHSANQQTRDQQIQMSLIEHEITLNMEEEIKLRKDLNLELGFAGVAIMAGSLSETVEMINVCKHPVDAVSVIKKVQRIWTLQDQIPSQIGVLRTLSPRAAHLVVCLSGGIDCWYRQEHRRRNRHP
jgi:hypothetical protein